MNKDMFRGLCSLSTGAAWGVDPWDLPPVEEGRQASLPSAQLGEDRTAGLSEPLVKSQVTSPWGPWI